VPNLISQAFLGYPLTIYGDGSQTRSLCYVDDLVEGIWRLLGADFSGHMNIGNPGEVKILELAERVSSLVGNGSEIVFAERPETTPRCGVLTSPRPVSCWGGSLTSR
jgi:nucleoside-diphosphate-sugar epimerase